MTRCTKFARDASGLFLLVGLFLAPAPGTRAEEVGSFRAVATVGMPARISGVVLPGSELEVRPLDDRRGPMVVRIAEVYRHGSAMRYDLVFYGLEPGAYDLKDSLIRKDGSALGELPSIPVRVDPVLPPGQIEPHPLTLRPAPWLGGYRLVLGLVGSLWCAGLAAILLLRRRKPEDLVAADRRPLTLADRLTPLVTAAMDGSLSPGQHAELERMLIGYWRRRLKLDHASPAQAIAAMKEDPEAGPLIRRLEDWLHRPAGSSAEAVDVASLLEPYRSLPADPDQEGAADEPARRLPTHALGRAR
ncbi:MAG: hypothetical protein U0790_09615 [Isosphaeraceae bacterium]